MNEVSSLEKPLPSNPEAEKVVIASIILNNDSISVCIDSGLSPDMFYLRRNKLIYQYSLEMWNEGLPIDYVTLIERINRDFENQQVVTLGYITEVIYGIPVSLNLESYISILREKYFFRTLIRSCNNLMTKALSQDCGFQELLEMAESEVYNLVPENQTQKLDDVSDLIEDSIERAEAILESDSSLVGVSSGYNDIDSRTLGFTRGDLIIIAGRPSSGKTSLALNIAANSVFRNTNRVCVFSLEMDKRSLADRVVCTEAEVDFQMYRSANLSDEDWSKIYDVRQISNQIGFRKRFFIDDSPGVTVSYLRARLRRLVKFLRPEKLDLVVVDYLQLMNPSQRLRNENRQQEITRISRDLKLLAKEFDIPLIVLSQLSRAPENRAQGNHRPILSDLRESGSIEQDGDIVAFVYREDMYKKDPTAPDTGVAELIFSKFRNGPVGTEKLLFLSHCTKFVNMPNDF